jgi:hypothetical protein
MMPAPRKSLPPLAIRYDELGRDAIAGLAARIV